MSLLLRPVRFDLVEPGRHGDQALKSQCVDASAGVSGIGRDLDDAGGIELAEVPARGRSRRPEPVGDRTGTLWAVLQQLDDPAASRVSEREERRIESTIINDVIDHLSNH